MANQSKRAESISATQLRTVADLLRHFSETCSKAAEIADAQPTKSLAIFNWSSAEFGLDRLRSFVAAAEKSTTQAKLGKPIEAGQFKPRSTAKTKSPSPQDVDKAIKKKPAKKRTQ
jgi:predicted signal transduction protein with EAL and GGDEF domain